jgi:hypothetical protein
VSIYFVAPDAPVDVSSVQTSGTCTWSLTRSECEIAAFNSSADGVLRFTPPFPQFPLGCFVIRDLNGNGDAVFWKEEATDETRNVECGPGWKECLCGAAPPPAPPPLPPDIAFLKTSGTCATPLTGTQCRVAAFHASADGQMRLSAPEAMLPHGCFVVRVWRTSPGAPHVTCACESAFSPEWCTACDDGLVAGAPVRH